MFNRQYCTIYYNSVVLTTRVIDFYIGVVKDLRAVGWSSYRPLPRPLHTMRLKWADAAFDRRMEASNQIYLNALAKIGVHYNLQQSISCITNGARQ